jgi:lipopolysaccharide cholinephosphotransferase
MIGAVRHSGYIPWDDDIDISLPRIDFNKFIEIASEKLPDPFFLKTTLTDVGYYSNSIYVCNSDTTCIEKNPYNRIQKFNKGISIGISALDNCSDNFLNAKIFRQYIRVSALIANIKVGFNKWKISKYIRSMLNLLKYDHKKAWLKLQRKITKYSEKNSKSNKITTFSPIVQKFKNVYWDKEDFNASEQMDFEFLKVSVAVGFNNILTIQFGKYMDMPDEKERKPKHGLYFDTKIPYKKYCTEKFGIKYED